MATTLPNADWHLPPRPAWLPEDNGLLAANYDPLLIDNANAAPAAFHFPHKVWIPAGKIITNTHLYVVAAGSSIADYYMAVYEAYGVRAAMSAAQTTLLESTGFKTFPMAVPVPAENRGRWVYVAIVPGSGTVPAIAMKTAPTNVGLVSPNLMNGYIFLSGPPATTLTYSAMTDYYNFWVGIS